MPLWRHFNRNYDGKIGECSKIKIMVSFRSYPTRNRIFQKNSKKIQKIRKYRYGFISIQNRQEKSEKETKSKLSFRFVPTHRVIENSEKIAKKFDILKNTIMNSFQAKVGWKRIRKREIKITVPFRSYPTRVIKSQKKQRKNSKN